ncbi:uncharacterized protein Z520_07861 [Fonsecaea multimorphosa CBS 102226]|uniref:Uncharacterized protein n=1 Tax=Fonsecaea multimorphosa CBS 102226 TaxID=1442371 RepID=A0A0D2H424_9EURO|nr:uncharacterized protein Z520_07861 [Fonsecaea multimorphosa CBS 102226]KIX96595.1 hypothetical protein Z520_07861 [Fonsecaea multimorphosa CBS 102226]OAL22107.1 hypothetical protein AYO22_07467 [Fonsecaea multimorphosa]
MPSPTQPTLPSSSSPSADAPAATPTDPNAPNADLQAINNNGRHSPGAIAGITICVLVVLAWILRYSYVASPFWFLRIRRCLGIRPATRTPISHYPISNTGGGGADGGANENETRGPYITQPEPAHIRTTASKDTLPLYEPSLSNQFSSDVLQALMNLPGQGSDAGVARPPSYRSRLSQEWRSVMGTRARNRNREDEESVRTGARDRGDDESMRSVSDARS